MKKNHYLALNRDISLSFVNFIEVNIKTILDLFIDVIRK